MRTNIHFNPPFMRTARGRHLLELLAVILLIIVVAVGAAYWLSTRTAPVSVESTGLTAPATRFADMKQHQAEAREPIVAPARSTGLTAPATRFADMKQHQAEAREPAVPATSVLVAPATQSVLDYLRVHGN